MKVILFSKYLKFHVDFQKAIKFWENVDGFEDICVWNEAFNFYQLWQECMWAAVNVLKSDPNIPDYTYRHQKQVNLFDINTELV